MHEISLDVFRSDPEMTLGRAPEGECLLVVDDLRPAFLLMPLPPGVDARPILVDLAITLFDRELVSLGRAALLAGLSRHEMLDELSRRQIPVIRTTAKELAQQLRDFGAD